jgi:hypothetical protein
MKNVRADFRTREAAIEWITDNGFEVVTDTFGFATQTFQCKCGDCDGIEYFDAEYNHYGLTICEQCGERE